MVTAGYNSGMIRRQLPRQLLLILILSILLTTSVIPLDNPTEQARRFTRRYEFDYITWTVDAIEQKTGQWRLNSSQRLTENVQSQAVLRYFELIGQLERVQSQIEVVFADPGVEDPDTAAAELLKQQDDLQQALTTLAPLTESILQEQVSQVLVDYGIGFLSQSIPPVLFHSTPLPKALIVSPRDTIKQEVNISLLSDLSLEEIVELEDQVAASMDSSVLVVDVGGIGVYPTMVQRTSDLRWTVDTIAHEWTHNYLTLHPLGLNYETTPELRTMNETTASIVGTEISNAVLARYYPELSARSGSVRKTANYAPAQDSFNFQREMHLTRIMVDQMLAEGKIEEAEQYMEQRRIIFAQHGYMIRKLNQAYFAFHGAYADVPEGAAGEDPVGPAVRAFRSQSESLGEFLKQIARMNSFTQLQDAVD